MFWKFTSNHPHCHFNPSQAGSQLFSSLWEWQPKDSQPKCPREPTQHWSLPMAGNNVLAARGEVHPHPRSMLNLPSEASPAGHLTAAVGVGETDLRPSLHFMQTTTKPSHCGNWFSFNADEEPQAESWCSLLLMLILTPSPAFKTRISCPAAGQERVIWIYFLVKSAAVYLDNHNSSTVIIKLNFMWYAGNFMAVLINITLVGTYIK